MIEITQKGKFETTTLFLTRAKYVRKSKKLDAILQKYGEMGVAALKAATPVDTGKTADSWGYEIVHPEGKRYSKIIFTNSNISQDWANVAILLQYGHATRNGGYVLGRDYINPALQPIFDQIANDTFSAICDVPAKGAATEYII